MRNATRRKISIAVLILIILGGVSVATRLYLPTWIQNYVNAQIQALPGYGGSVGPIDVALYRGAYTLYDLKIVKTGGGMPVPCIAIETMDISVQWPALLRGRVVARIHAEKPTLNFAVNKAGTQIQTGKGVSWTDAIKKLVPIDINQVTVQEGRLFYRDFSTEPQVSLFISHLNGKVTNVRNIEEPDAALPSTIDITGDSIGKGHLKLAGNMNLLKDTPDMAIDASLENVFLPALNDYFEAFAALDVKKGDFDCYVKLAIKDGQVDGFVKPIARNIELIDLSRDTNPVQLVWQTLASTVLQLFTNQRKDQFATEIPLSGNIDNVETDLWASVFGILRNAFVQAIEKGFSTSE
jgi:uncharacterized protein involved in outer membrane biogenesis